MRLARDGERRRAGVTFLSVSSPGDPRAALIAGLMADPPRIASGHFYDSLGCKLFEAITELPEYGLTRAEAALFAAHGEELGTEARARLGGAFQLVDLGAGNCAKAESLLPALAPSRYVAVDIAEDFLKDSLARVADRHPGLAVAGVGMDFLHGFRLPAELADQPTLFFWPGSSIGNCAPEEALAFLREVRASVPAAALLLGADLVRDAALLEAAYDDAAGVTAAFNRNILVAVNRALGSDFDPRAFTHRACFNAQASRVEMWLTALADQEVSWPGGGRTFRAGTGILTEISTKWTHGGLTSLLEKAGFPRPRLWQGADFALVLGG
ncbi:MAG: L-histidine N(alpha)-methyltransferase [Sphingomonadaceae bacterium]